MAYLDADMQFFIYVKNSRNKGKLFHNYFNYFNYLTSNSY